MMGAVVSFSLMALSGREALLQLDTFELMLYRSLVGIIIVLTIGGLAGTLGQIKLRNMKLHITRNLFHFVGQNLWFYAVALIPFAQLFALEFSFPIWVALAAPFLLGEKLTKPRVFSAIVGFAGVLIVTRPGIATFDLGVLAGALCAIGFAGSYIYTKKLTRVASVICILFWMSVIQA
ncbi:MAG: DMT family transporter, partial [Rhodobacteraceae bacterium]|nr:DMT family transporter [Paracoccaceae bacterium]